MLLPSRHPLRRPLKDSSRSSSAPGSRTHFGRGRSAGSQLSPALWRIMLPCLLLPVIAIYNDYNSRPQKVKAGLS
ncbi:hypothetical protein VN24_15715 [Paenibacillus beijingensis]|uniref:Uncharacterized protein n=1 Tax=Paenibacillus beijingensis TaxID=1126833 RepID=A0A0D5NLE0_9BACL|nr:hypothetical protein VN24_15715 [Paenibacillus beijingensis]